MRIVFEEDWGDDGDCEEIASFQVPDLYSGEKAKVVFKDPIKLNFAFSKLPDVVGEASALPSSELLGFDRFKFVLKEALKAVNEGRSQQIKIAKLNVFGGEKSLVPFSHVGNNNYIEFSVEYYFSPKDDSKQAFVPLVEFFNVPKEVFLSFDDFKALLEDAFYSFFVTYFQGYQGLGEDLRADEPCVGLTLLTKDGRKSGNCIIADEVDGVFSCLTDFGNRITLTEKEIAEGFYLGQKMSVKEWLAERDKKRLFKI